MINSPLAVFIRWLLYVSTLTSIGASAFKALTLPKDDPQTAMLIRGLRPLELISLFVLAVSAVANLITFSVAMAGGGDSLVSTWRPVLLVTHYGLIWRIRMGLILALWTLFLTASDTWLALRLWLALGVGWTIALTGHAADQGDWTWRIFNDAIHVGSAGIWIGGLPSLVFMLNRKQKFGDVTEDYVNQAVSRFSRTAGFCLLAVTVSGVLNAYVSLPGISSLWQTRYGQVLSIKLILVVVVVSLGAYHRYRLLPQRAWVWLRRSVIRELGVALLVIAATAVLCDTIPAIHAMHNGSNAAYHF